jgi:hypothetical protein
MSWYKDWQALSARIEGLLDAGTFFYNALQHSSSDDQGVRKKILLKNADKIISELNKFLKQYQSVLPREASESLSNFLKLPDIEGLNFNPDPGQVRGFVQFALTSLAAFRSEFSYLIADTQAVARRITELAFIHLQRSISVDDELRNKWLTAYTKHGEPKCEKLGALHLLWHGVWAFKAHADKGRTDLILNEPILDTSIIEQSAVALVLTEWKIVRQENELKAKIQEAFDQTKLYSSGVLGGIELRNCRYLVMVTDKCMEMPKDFVDDMITYRHINVAVNPDIPSKAVR